jgi:hypothetical protein
MRGSCATGRAIDCVATQTSVGMLRGSSRVPDDSSWKPLFAKNHSPCKHLMLSFFEHCPTWGDSFGKLPFQASLTEYQSDAFSFLLMIGLILLSHVRVSFYIYKSASLASLTLQRPFRTNLSSNLGELKALSVFQAGSWIRSHSRCLGMRGGKALTGHGDTQPKLWEETVDL